MSKNKLLGGNSLYILSLVAASVCTGILLSIGIKEFFIVASGSNVDNKFTGFSLARLIFNLSYIFLIFIYIIWLTQKSKQYSSFFKIVKISSPFLILAYLAYPLSTDFYLYLQYGWMFLHGINPYLHTAIELPSSLIPYLAWKNQTSSYGPLSMGIFTISAVGVYLNLFVALYILKVFCLLFHLLNSFLIWRFLDHSPNQSKFTVAFILNPALLSAFIMDIHVDVFLCTSIILLIGFLNQQRFILVILTLFSGFLTKTIPIIWLPLILSFLIIQRRWKDIAIGLTISLFFVILLSLTILPNVAAWTSLLNNSVSSLTARSFYHLINVGLGQFLNISDVTRQTILNNTKLLGYTIFFIFYIFLLSRMFLSKNYSKEMIVADIGWITFCLFLVATPWFMPWYSSILLPIALLSNTSSRFLLILLTFCLSPTLIYGTGSGGNILGMLSALSTVIPPVLAMLFGHRLLKDTVLLRE